MKISLIFGMIALFAFVSFTQTTFAIETEQEPGPPQIPEPSPAPEPIRMPDPVPAPDPFPEESNSEKIKRLTKENDNLKQQKSTKSNILA
jgi:outer membrane biosynthesis protein TonB